MRMNFAVACLCGACALLAAWEHDAVWMTVDAVLVAANVGIALLRFGLDRS